MPERTAAAAYDHAWHDLVKPDARELVSAQDACVRMTRDDLEGALHPNRN